MKHLSSPNKLLFLKTDLCHSWGRREYKVEGSKIIATAVGEMTSETMTVAKLTDDELVLQFKKGDKVTYKRVKDKWSCWDSSTSAHVTL